MRRLLAFVFLPALVSQTIPAVASVNPSLATPVLVDALMRPYLQNHMFNGVIAIAHNGKIDFIRTYGVPANGKFRIASITKTFTGAAIELLQQRGRLAYTETLASFLPQFPNAANITIGQLLLHQAGLADPNYAGVTSAATLDTVIADIAATPPLFAPGSRSQYSNAGYVVLAKVVEVASGEPFATFLNREFFTPLQLSNTLPENPHQEIPGRLKGYFPGPPPAYRIPVPFEEITAYTGSGNLLSTASDLVQWAEAVGAGTIVKPTDYPYGWGKRSYLQHQVIEQSGEEHGFISYLVHDITADLTVVVLSNLEAGPNDRIGKAVYAFATLDAPRIPPSFGGAMEQLPSGNFEGRYGIFSIFRKGAAYFAQWKGGTALQYLRPAGPRSYFLPIDSSTITVVDQKTLARQWGTDPPVIFNARP
jgi:CubicO group peptidase (beta-lactamase class C family)